MQCARLRWNCIARCATGTSSRRNACNSGVQSAMSKPFSIFVQRQIYRRGYTESASSVAAASSSIGPCPS